MIPLGQFGAALSAAEALGGVLCAAAGYGASEVVKFCFFNENKPVKEQVLELRDEAKKNIQENLYLIEKEEFLAERQELVLTIENLTEQLKKQKCIYEKFAADSLINIVVKDAELEAFTSSYNKLKKGIVVLEKELDKLEVKENLTVSDLKRTKRIVYVLSKVEVKTNSDNAQQPTSSSNVI